LINSYIYRPDACFARETPGEQKHENMDKRDIMEGGGGMEARTSPVGESHLMGVPNYFEGNGRVEGRRKKISSRLC